MRVLLDTCAIIWAVGEPERLSTAGAAVLRDAATDVYVSVVSSAEIACAVRRNRLQLDRHWKPWFRHHADVNGWQILPIDLSVVEEAYSLPEPFHSDPVDRILVATARRHDLHLLTGDRHILEYPHVTTLW